MSFYVGRGFSPAVLVLALAAVAHSGATQAPAGPTLTPLEPLVRENATVTFRLLAPQAAAVSASIDTVPVSSVGMTKDARGVWSGVMGPVEPDIYDYAFIVDGVQIHVGLVDVPGPKPQAWTPRSVPHGAVHVLWYESQALGMLRSVYVYTPPGYEKSTTSYPVFFLLHGSGGAEDVWVKIGAANVILDNAIADGAARPMIVVMPFGHTEPSPRAGRAATYTGRDADGFARDLLGDVMPLVQRTYRVSNKADDRAIGGFSMGGGQARQIGLSHLDLFHAIAVMSNGFGVAAESGETLESAYQGLLEDPAVTNATLRLLWFGQGKDEARLVSQNQAFSSLLGRYGIKHTFVTIPGGHTWHVWRRNLRDILPLLFRR